MVKSVNISTNNSRYIPRRVSWISLPYPDSQFPILLPGCQCMYMYSNGLVYVGRYVIYIVGRFETLPYTYLPLPMGSIGFEGRCVTYLPNLALKHERLCLALLG